MSAITVATKKCRRCGEVKPLDDFHRNRKSDDGRHGECAVCMNARSNAYNARRRAEMGEQAWRDYKAAAVRRSRERTGNKTGKVYAQAQRQAASRLRERHRREYDELLRLALYERGAS